MGLPSLKSNQSIPILPVRRFWWRSWTMITWLANKWLNHCCPILSRRQQELDYKSKHCQHIPMQSIRSISDYRSHPAFRCLTWKSEKCWQPPATDVKCIFSNHLVKSHSTLLQEVQQRIKEEFVRTKTDPECQEAYSSFQYLHEKLDHIKKLVHKYDQERLGSR